MYRVSVTTIESFRRYITEASPFDTEEKLLESIKGIFIGNPKTEFGSAYHYILEGKHRPAFKGSGVWAKGFSFTEQQAAPALQYRRDHSDIVSEVQVSKIYQTKFFPIQVSGRVDAIEGMCVRDGKTKFRSIDWQEYQSSCQWKFYLDMLNADVFYYDVFEVKGFPDDASMNTKIYPDVVIKDYESYKCIGYTGVSAEINLLLNDFLDFVANRNLWQYLKPALTYDSILD